jgi:hypothetical protein
VQEFQRMMHNGIIYTTATYASDKKNNDSYFESADNMFFRIEKIICLAKNKEIIYLIATQLNEVQSPDYFPHHIHQVHSFSESKNLVLNHNIKRKLYFMDAGAKKYFSFFPGKHHHC